MQNYPTTNTQSQTGFNREVDLEKLLVDYNKHHHPTGKDMFNRLRDFSDFIQGLKDMGLYVYDRRTLNPPATECHGMDGQGNIFYGLNFASADYLGLSQSEFTKEAAKFAADEYGVNSCGSPLAFGAHKYYYQLQMELQEFWGIKEIMLLSAGWMAGFGAIKALVKANDFVVMDELCHNCLLEGAKAATKNITKTKHLCNVDMEEKIKALREQNPDQGIFVITEGLFSMDADTADLIELQKITKKYEAFLMIDSAHDFGCMGPTGKGCWEGMKDFENVILMAGGSKCLSTNLGWIGCNNHHVLNYLRVHCTAYMFTNAVNPIQCSTALAQLRILASEHGNIIRKKTIENYKYTRAKFESYGYRCIGNPCPILIVFIGNEVVSRIVSRLMMDNGVHVNGIEYPVVAMGHARLRLNLQPQHSRKNLDLLVETFDRVMKEAQVIFERSLEKYQAKMEAKGPEIENNECRKEKNEMNAKL